MQERADELPGVQTEIDLRYVCAGDRGYMRIKKGKEFLYVDESGRTIDNPKILERIQKLVLPPAWTEVWICAHANGHLQAVGYDSKGRKQYRYHTQWSAFRNQTKFAHIYFFGKALPGLRQQLKKDIRRRTLGKEKVCAIALATMDKTYIRAGNETYEKENGSFGLTTLKSKHITIDGSSSFFRFKGKKGVQQQITLKNSSLIKLLKQVKEIPGQKLFQYYDPDGTIQQLDSGDLNGYLKQHTSGDFTCKDFRTWAGCVLALLWMMETVSEEEVSRQKQLVSIIDQVAGKLGNTRSVTRNYYIHPKLLNAYEQGDLDIFLKRWKKSLQNSQDPYACAERALLSFLKR